MSNYFRITVYHPVQNISAIMDSNGKFEKLWQFSAHLVGKDFKIVSVAGADNFSEGNIPMNDVPTDTILLRACAQGQPEINGNTITIRNKFYDTN